MRLSFHDEKSMEEAVGSLRFASHNEDSISDDNLPVEEVHDTRCTSSTSASTSIY